VGRLAGRPYYDGDWNVQLDFSGEYVFKPAINQSGTPNVNVTTFNLQDRPEDRAADQNWLTCRSRMSAFTAARRA
jgi:hypothetical protein